jgi:hypothetical protein
VQQRTFANSRLLIIERKKEKPPRGRLRNPIRCFGQAASAAAFRFLRPAEQRVRRTKKCCPRPLRKIRLRLLPKQRIMYFHPGTATGGDYVNQKSIFGLLFGNACIR